MTIFGTIGLLVRWIPLPSAAIAMVRGLVGILFLLLVMGLLRRRPDWGAIRRNLPMLLLSGGAIGLNWVLLFESYRHTTVAVATLCYYMAPMLVLLAAPVVLKEVLTRRKVLCMACAFVGMALVSGTGAGATLTGVLLGLGAAVLYASVLLMNRRLQGLSAWDMTILQLGMAALVVAPYALLTGGLDAMGQLSPTGWLLLAVAGVVHTGVAYALFFYGVQGMKASAAAIWSYLDPVVAIVLSALVLQEPMTPAAGIGAAMILGASLLSERK